MTKDDNDRSWILIAVLVSLAIACGLLATYSKIITGGWTCAFRDCTGEL